MKKLLITPVIDLFTDIDVNKAIRILLFVFVPLILIGGYTAYVANL